MQKIILMIIIFTSLTLTACGSSSDTQISQSSTTIGQEIIDLNKSYQQGLISEKEYKSAKKDILNRYD